jgi:hypothetical protein
MDNAGQANVIGDPGPKSERQAALERMRTASSVSISPELFEKMFMSPPTAVRGDTRSSEEVCQPNTNVNSRFLIGLQLRS